MCLFLRLENIQTTSGNHVTAAAATAAAAAARSRRRIHTWLVGLATVCVINIQCTGRQMRRKLRFLEAGGRRQEIIGPIRRADEPQHR